MEAIKDYTWVPSKMEAKCGGTIDLLTNKGENTVVVKFLGVKRGKECKKCPFVSICTAEEIKEEPKLKVARVKAVEGHVQVYAFTGMWLASLPIEKETETTVETTSKSKTKLIFDKATGIQVNAKNPNFANRIDVG